MGSFRQTEPGIEFYKTSPNGNSNPRICQGTLTTWPIGARTMLDYQFSGRFGVERARDHEPVEPPRLGVELSPVVEREINHRESRGRELLDQPLARLDIARRHQQGGELGQ